MGQLSAAAYLDFEVPGSTNSAPVAASQTIYKGSAVGYTGGYARQLTAGDIFAGFAEETVVNSVATDGAKTIELRAKGVVTLAITSIAVTDIGKPVYASDGATFTLTASTNTRIGTVKRWISTGYVQVEFDATDANAMSGVVTLTDSTTGTASDTLAAGVGVETITIPIQLATIAADTVTTYTVGYKFKILGTSFLVTTAATTGSKAATLNLEIGTTNVTGGELALTSANMTPLGAVVAGTAVTGTNTGAANATISVEASSITAFGEGAGLLLIRVQNMDTADAVASIAAKLNQLA